MLHARNSRTNGRRRGLAELTRRPDLLDAAGVENGDAIGKIHRLALVVGDDDGRQPGAPLALRAKASVYIAADPN
jgi:hypothetical protein